MMPVSLLVALLLAFGMDELSPTEVPQADVIERVLETCGGITLVAALALGLGFWVVFQVSHSGEAKSKLRRRYTLCARVLTILALAVYAWIIHWVGWSKLVRTNWGLSRLILVDDFVVFLPYLLIQVLVWWGSFFAERALQVRLGLGAARGLGRYLVLRARQSLGLILPVILMYMIRRDFFERYFPGWEENPLAGPIEMALVGALVLSIVPLFVRLAWPARSLAPGPLRRRLERIGDRVGFRFTDILVWDTGGMMVNACVTGILPGFRYVLLSDALLESLTPLEVAAVFGHEIGHVAHRHFIYFAFFFVGSLGGLSLLAEILSKSGPWIANLAWVVPSSASFFSEVMQGGVLLLALGLYFWIVFGHVSRRFERQADVFGSKVVSCDLNDCPPHTDLDTDGAPEPIRGRKPILCPVGIRIFADALMNVARSNGMDQNVRSWRHGSIATRVAFLEGLERRPEREQSFQQSVLRLQIGLGIVLALAALLWVIGQSWGLLR
jgi:STE24 endopeptidase